MTFNKVIKGLSIAVSFIIVFASCDKGFEQVGSFSSFAVIHASPVASASPTDTIHVFLDNGMYSSAGITYLGNSGYLSVASGTKTVNLRRKAMATSDVYITPFSHNFEPSKIYSFFAYDTTTSATSAAKVLRLTDDLTLPAAGMAHVRALHLAPNGPAVDITLLRTSVTPNDSVTISNRSYVGAQPNEAALSVFTPIPRGTYTAKVKLAGTQTVAASATVTLSPGPDVGLGRIVTIFVTGTAKNRPLAIGTFRHY